MLNRLTSGIDAIRGRLQNTGYASGNRSISLISNWLANVLWLIETKFLPLAREAYGQNEVVYSCLRLLAQTIPEPPLLAYQGNGEKRALLPDNHSLMQLIRRPNPLLTEYELIELITLHLAITGRSTWWKQRNNAGQTIALWPMRPDRVGPIYSDADDPEEAVLWGYSYQVPGSGQFIPLARRDVLAVNFPDIIGESGGLVEGFGPLQALAREIAADNKATAFVGALLANYAAPTIALKLKGAIPNEQMAQLIKAKFRHEFGGANLGTPAVVDGDAEIQVIGFNLRELEFPELREVAETRIAAAIGVPAVLVGLRAGLMRSTYSNVAEARRLLAETTATNYWRRYQDVFTRDLAREFGEDITCEFDTSKVKALAGVYVELAQPVKDAFAAGVATVNEYRVALKQGPLDPEYGEVLYVPNSVTVVAVTEAARAAIEKRKVEAPEPRALAAGGEEGESEEMPAKSAPALKAIDPRDAAEHQLRRILEELFAKQGSEVVDQILGGEAIDYAAIEAQISTAIEPQLVETMAGENIRVAQQIGVQFDPALVNETAATWARQYTYDMVRGLTDTTRKVLQRAIETFQKTPGMTRAELEALLSGAFGPERASVIASTEVTRASAQAFNQYQRDLDAEGVKLSRRWNTAHDEKTCFLCQPLNRKLEKEWVARYPDGPPAHPACRCSLTLTATEEGA